MSSSVIVLIKTIGDPNPKLDRLNLADNLLNIRKELEKHNTINDTLSFSKKYSKEFAEIVREKEKDFLLKETIEVINDDDLESYHLYLMKNSGLSWNILNKKYKLDYGRTMSFDGIKRANKRAFTMNYCELTEINAEGYKKDQLEFESKEDWIKKTNLFVEADDINVMNFAKLGLSVGKLQNENFNDEIRLTYQYTELGKVSLKFGKENLELTDDFENDVIDAINSKDPRNFKKITKKYGQFIATEVILGGRVYFKDFKTSSENSKEDSTNINSLVNAKIRDNSKRNSKFYNFNHMKILGGQHPNDKDFDEKAWIESLKNYQNWNCIEFKNPISIFQFLPNYLWKKAFKSIGKRILYTWIEDYDCDFHGRPKIYELDNLSQNTLNIILNKDADCDIFAVVINTEDSKNVFFTCQILREEQKVKPSIIIHGIQEEFQKCKYKLKIKIMVIGYDTNFNFILSDTSVQLMKQDVHNLENQCKFYSIPLQLKNDLITRNVPFVGIPILSNFGSSNNSLVIGHNFCNSQSDNELKIDIFSYCLKNKLYAALPKFTFCTLIILNNHNHTSNTYESFPFKFSIWEKKPFIDLKETSIINPKYISLYLSEDNNYRPVFLNQRSKQIRVEHVNCNCSNTCFICMNKKSTITDQNDIECKVYSLSDNLE